MKSPGSGPSVTLLAEDLGVFLPAKGGKSHRLLMGDNNKPLLDPDPSVYMSSETQIWASCFRKNWEKQTGYGNAMRARHIMLPEQ